ncbi:MBL fold metallo-hydrolase [Streptomyces sp. NBC_00287]|uniref:ComEC/Rec2 family competence protein n=1 Tax=Streptomyces sp. NBC_00287 TaxID=2975702 RepID=UPI002E2C4872|nr:MBL fold metallo-hydrolase [Streptomyces sp. NBC_00287]
MFTFDFLNARHGDSFLVRWGSPKAKVMLVDGGPSQVFEKSLRERLSQLPADAQGIPRIDIVCLSHVDDDHAVGLLKLLRQIEHARDDQEPDPFAVKRVWFNSVDELVDRVSPGLSASTQEIIDRASEESRAVRASYNQGRAIRDAAAALGLDGNPLFDGPLIEGEETTLAQLHITVVAPDNTALQKLTERWRKARQLRDPSVITSAYADDSIPNLSSIVLMLTHRGRTALLTGDARGDRILAGLRATGLLDDTGPLHVDLLKLPHHGSDRNVESDFFENIHADHYVISADGVKHHHPSEDTLRMLVDSRDRDDEYTIHLTNRIGFADDTLDELRNNRNFTVDVRAAADLALVIKVGDEA